MNKEHIYITFDQLGLVLCDANTKRKLIEPIYDKTSLNAAGFLYYTGYVLRDSNNSKKYYSEDEVKDMIINFLYNKICL